jgi:hypothetical protein
MRGDTLLTWVKVERSQRDQESRSEQWRKLTSASVDRELAQITGPTRAGAL